MEMDDERLICLVQEHPELYDKKSPLYKLTNRKRSVWEAIGEELQCPGELCARRWTSLRERFSKESRKAQEPSGSVRYPERPWPFLEQMMFLKPHIIPRPFRWSKNECPAPQPKHEEILSSVAWSPETSMLDRHSTVLSPSLQIKSEETYPSPVSQHQSDVSYSAMSDSQSLLLPNSPPPESKPSKRKRKINEDNVEELMVDAINSFKSYCEARETTPNSMVDGFANFMKSTLSTVDRAKQTRIIKHVTTIVMDAVADPNY